MDMKFFRTLAFLTPILFSSCDKQAQKENLLKEVLAHYAAPGDSLQRKSALFLITHIDGNSTGESGTDDLGNVDAAYLIRNIDLALQAASQSLKTGSLSFADFCEYVLPYRLANEPLTAWREQNLKTYGPLRDSCRLVEDPNLALCTQLSARCGTGFRYNAQAAPARYQSWDDLIKNKEGDCWVMTSLVSYPARALGVAVTTDFVPMWGNSNGGPHAWNAMVSSKHGWAKFMGCESSPAFPADYDPLGVYHYQRRSAKVFRKTYSINQETLPHLIADEDAIPYNLRFDRVIDVTEEYVPTSDIEFELKDGLTPEMVYLATFSNGEWVPVFWAKPQKSHCRFSKMAKGLMYLPCTYHAGKGVTALDAPFYIDEATGRKVVCRPDARQKTVIAVTQMRDRIAEEAAVYGLGRTGIAFHLTMDSICLGQKYTAPVQNEFYRLYYWDNGWQPAGEQQKPAHGPLQFVNVPAGALYRVLPASSKNTERFFTYSHNQQLWW
ncbi:transglutaminase domain-containing protein [Larkinella bovis]|uniref:Transglutaminase domain-containing protein n=1 Tax=Larkinella bovis TaxID=683041 RepID=A0ABW0IDX1_9BACT